MAALTPDADAAPTAERLAWLSGRALRPDRPRLGPATSVATGCDLDAHAFAPGCPRVDGNIVWLAHRWWLPLVHETPQELWEALASRGVVPPAWAADARRTFAEPCALCGATGRHDRAFPDAPCHGCNGARVVRWDHPPSAAACLALAGDPAGVATAEALAREVAARLAAEGVFCDGAARAPARAPEDVVWRLVEASYVPQRCVTRMLLEQLGLGSPRQWKAEARAKSAAWMARADAKSVKDWKGFGDGKNPYEPLVDLWATGYALDDVTPAAVVLVAPEP